MIRIAPHLKGHCFPGTGLASQIVTSATNFLLVLELTRNLTIRELGLVSFWLAGLTLTVHALRQVCFDEFFLRPDTPSSVLGMAALVGVSVSSAMFIAALLAPELRTLLAVLSIATGIAAMQDAFRYAAFAQDKPMTALIGDGLWLTVTLALWVALSSQTGTRPEWSAFAWMFGALVSVCYLKVALQFDYQFTRGVRHPFATGTVKHRVAALVASVATGYGMLWLVGALSGLEASGAARAILTAQGPSGIARTAISLRALKIASKPKGHMASLRDLAMLSILASVGFSVGLILLPSATGLAVFGETWPVVHDTRWIAALDMVVSGALVVPMSISRLRRPRVLAICAWSAAALQLLVAIVVLRDSANYVYIGSSVAGGLALLLCLPVAMRFSPAVAQTTP